jgi:hypothetical protein
MKKRAEQIYLILISFLKAWTKVQRHNLYEKEQTREVHVYRCGARRQRQIHLSNKDKNNKCAQGFIVWFVFLFNFVRF